MWIRNVREGEGGTTMKMPWETPLEVEGEGEEEEEEERKNLNVSRCGPGGRLPMPVNLGEGIMGLAPSIVSFIGGRVEEAGCFGRLRNMAVKVNGKGRREGGEEVG